MDANFDKCLLFVLKWEGCYTVDPKDPGGETKWGISKRAYPELDIKNLSVETMKKIYRDDYWIPSGCQAHGWPMDLMVFDTAVNLGVTRALVMYQDNQEPLSFLLARIRFYLSITGKTKDRFLKGWLRRVIDLYDESRKKH